MCRPLLGEGAIGLALPSHLPGALQRLRVGLLDLLRAQHRRVSRRALRAHHLRLLRLPLRDELRRSSAARARCHVGGLLRRGFLAREHLLLSNARALTARHRLDAREVVHLPLSVVGTRRAVLVGHRVVTLNGPALLGRHTLCAVCGSGAAVGDILGRVGAERRHVATEPEQVARPAFRFVAKIRATRDAERVSTREDAACRTTADRSEDAHLPILLPC